MRVYLDWNATTPPVAAVLDAMREVAGRAWGNPSSVHTHGRAARAVVEDAREAVAELARVDPRDVIFTSGGTEANNIAIRSSFDAPTDEPSWLVTSRLEHPSVTRVVEALEAEGKARVRWIRVEEGGTIAVGDLEAALRELPAVALVCVQAVNHETGVVQPVEDVIRLAHAAGAHVHVDAIQAWGRIDVPGGADTMSLAGHKMRGPKGVGALIARTGVALSPVLRGGAQEKGVRPGTTDPTLAAGLGAAARHVAKSQPRWREIATRRDRLEAALVAERCGPRVVGDAARRAPHVSTMIWPGWSGTELVAALDLEGISVSSGAACSAGTVEPSPVLQAMIGEEGAASGVRVSLGDETTEDDVNFAIEAFRRVVARG